VEQDGGHKQKMRQHEWTKGKSGRQIRQTLKEARKAMGSEQAGQLEEGTEIAEDSARAEANAARSGRTQTTSRVLERLTDDRDMGDRLRALHARQQRLPLDMDAMQEQRGARTHAKETRDELVERLLDPVLTLQETAVLLDVCPTTVRRYTNRGVLNCFRTPGNQRRFRLSDVIGFMERRDTR